MTRALLLTVLIVATLDVAAADACSCAAARTPCAEFWRVSTVFAGTVQEISPVPERPGMLAIRFSIDQRGRGVDSDTVVIESAPQNGGNCGYTFRVGERYVVYASVSSGGPLTTNMCSGTKLAADAETDLAFLREVAGPPRGVRVFGHVRRVEHDLVSLSARDYGGVAGARVEVVGQTASRDVLTGKDGNYDFRDLPRGTYTVRVTPPVGLGLAGPPLPPDHHHPPAATVMLTYPSECAEIRTWPRTDAHISGMLMTRDGGPAEETVVDLIAASNAGSAAKQIPHVSARTGPDGRFIFGFIAPGKYVVGLNLKSPPPASQFDRRSYHPGVADPAQATIVTIEAGSRVALEPFALLESPVERRISGVVVWSDGTPAPDAILSIIGAGAQRIPLDAEGRFSVTLPYGAQFSLTARAGRMVDGRRVGGRSPYLQIGRNDRDAEVNLVLKPLQ